ncbi:hypothetical protein MRB53_003830 [Persea americana]|uniref:Uncharacterized protein n=1 Tax=Persea americana TaxID=3435 RepID=A0ACC2N1T9_PERAE|nr:hypothetical protein MRB53_003830 [Persea americana]
MPTEGAVVVSVLRSAVVHSVLRKLWEFISRHADLWRNADQYVKDIKSELECMKDLLRRANESTKEPWLKDLREVAYDIEDVIDCFEHGLQKGHKNPVEIIRNLFNRHDVATRIKNIKRELQEVLDREKKYTTNNGAGISSRHNVSEVMEDPRDSSPEISIDNPVGIEDSIKELVDWLREGRLVGTPRIEDWVIVTTTRSRKVTAYDHVYEVKPLQSDDAENLLRESVFSPNHGPIPPHLSHERILGKCEGLPLAIVKIGHLLRQKGANVIEWDKVADDYLNELVDYSMIQVAERSYCGKVKSYKVHPLMRKFFVLKAKEQNFYVFSTERQAASNSTVKIRRLSISGDDMNGSQDLSYVRSCFAFKANQSLVEGLWSKFKYLRVLDLENAPLKKFPPSLVKLKLLRYLSLANTDINSLPKTIRKLKIMQVLNLKGTLISQLPEEILELKQLRHLLMYSRSSAAATPCFDDVQAVRVPRRVGRLVALQKLSLMQVNGDQDDIVLRELGNLTQLRRLGVAGLRREDGWKICSSIQQMKNLNSLSVKSRNVDETLELEHQFSSPPTHLQRLHLQGRSLKLPGWILNLRHLTCLTLGWSDLKHDPFQEFDALPALEELTLLKAYGGNKLDCIQSGNGRGFPNLKLLSLNGLHRLETIHLVEGAMPNLQKIIIKSCMKLCLSTSSSALISPQMCNFEVVFALRLLHFVRYRATEAIATDFWWLKEREKKIAVADQEGNERDSAIWVKRKEKRSLQSLIERETNGRKKAPQLCDLGETEGEKKIAVADQDLKPACHLSPLSHLSISRPEKDRSLVSNPKPDFFKFKARGDMTDSQVNKRRDEKKKKKTHITLKKSGFGFDTRLQSSSGRQRERCEIRRRLEVSISDCNLLFSFRFTQIAELGNFFLPFVSLSISDCKLLFSFRFTQIAESLSFPSRSVTAIFFSPSVSPKS